MKRKQIHPDHRMLLLYEHKFKCSICNKKYSSSNNVSYKNQFEIDHIIPLSLGGTDDISNMQPLCVECHTEKTRKERALLFDLPVLKQINANAPDLLYRFKSAFNGMSVEDMRKFLHGWGEA